MVPVVLASGDFIATVCDNIANFVKALGSYVILIIGLALIIVSIVQLVKAFASKGSANWVVIIGCLFVGGLLTFGGWKILTNENLWGALGKNTVEEMMGDKPAPINDYDGGSGGTTTDAMVRKGMGTLSSKFIVPFGKAVAVSVGVILVIIAAANVAKYYFAHGRAQISWAKVAILCVLGSVLFTATPTKNDEGWTWIRDIAVGATKDSVDNITEGKSTKEKKDYSDFGAPGFGSSGSGSGGSSPPA